MLGKEQFIIRKRDLRQDSYADASHCYFTPTFLFPTYSTVYLKPFHWQLLKSDDGSIGFINVILSLQLYAK